MTENDQVHSLGVAKRRTLLQGALIAGVATPLLAACGSNDKKSADAGTTNGGAGTTTGGGATTSGGGSSRGGSGSSGGSALAKTSDIPEASGTIFADEGIVVTQPKSGEFKGFTNICTHLGCPVHDVTTTINCNCHGSQYSITDGSVVTGPATQALAAKPISVKGSSITLG